MDFIDNPNILTQYSPLILLILQMVGAMLGLFLQRKRDKLNRWVVAAWMFAPPMLGSIIYALIWILLVYRLDINEHSPFMFNTIASIVMAIVGGLAFTLVLAALVAFSSFVAYIVNKRLGERIKSRYLQYVIGVLTPYLLAVLIPALIWCIIVAYVLWWPK